MSKKEKTPPSTFKFFKESEPPPPIELEYLPASSKHSFPSATQIATGEMVYHLGRLAPLGPTFDTYGVRNPQQRTLVNDLRLAPSQRTKSCYSPEFHLAVVGTPLSSPRSPGGLRSPTSPLSGRPRSSRPSSPFHSPHGSTPSPFHSPTSRDSLRDSLHLRLAQPQSLAGGFSPSPAKQRPSSAPQPQVHQALHQTAQYPQHPRYRQHAQYQTQLLYSSHPQFQPLILLQPSDASGQPSPTGADENGMLPPSGGASPRSPRKSAVPILDDVYLGGGSDAAIPSALRRSLSMTASLIRESFSNRPGSANSTSSTKLDPRALQRVNSALHLSRSQSRAGDAQSSAPLRLGHGQFPDERQVRAATRMSSDYGGEAGYTKGL